MPNANYISGRRAEYQVRDMFTARGYTVMRAAGSKGKIDLAAWNVYEMVLIQVKAGRKATKKERVTLAQMEIPPGARVELWERVNGEWSVEVVVDR